MKRIMKLFRNEEGATAVEYAIMVAAIAAVVIVTAILLGDNTSTQLGNVANQIPVR
ncbi:MAG: Flp family type IVb pilin [bacterium]